MRLDTVWTNRNNYNSQKQDAASQDSEKSYTKSYSKYRTSDMPKRDNPSDYSGTIPPYSYRAQNPAGSGQQQTQSQQTSNAKQGTQYNPRQQANTQQQNFSDTFEKFKKTLPARATIIPLKINRGIGNSQCLHIATTATDKNWTKLVSDYSLFASFVYPTNHLAVAQSSLPFSIGIGMLILIGCAILIYKILL